MIAPIAPTPMDNERLGALLRELCGELGGEKGHWQFVFNGVQMLCMTDERFDRMRFIAEIRPLEQVTPEQMAECMEANFDKALDARFCVFGGRLWSAFIHPLSELSEGFARNGLKQVAELTRNFGSSYSSGSLSFVGGE